MGLFVSWFHPIKRPEIHAKEIMTRRTRTKMRGSPSRNGVVRWPPLGGFGNGEVEVRLFALPGAAMTEEEHDSAGQSLPVNGYMMDIGLIKVFP